MKTLTRLMLQHEVDETLYAIVDKSKRVDHFATHAQELTVQAVLYDRWQQRVGQALVAIRTMRTGLFFPAKPTPDQVMSILTAHLSGDAITSGLSNDIFAPIGEAFNKGRASVNAMFTKQTGREVFQKDLLGFGAIFGLTEDHALQAMIDQMRIAAGGLWDEQLSDSIKNELQKYFDATETRDELIQAIEQVVNTRLAIGGASSLPTSYFDNLATHQIVRARNVGSYYRAKSLGAVHYTLINPHDHRTSPICNEVTQGQIYTMPGAEQTVSGILQARSVSDLKAVAPFYKKGDEVVNPVPPLHWPKCRTWMNFVFEG